MAGRKIQTQGNGHDDKLLVTVDVAAQRLSIGRTTAYQLMDRGLLQYVYVGRNRRVLAASLTEYVNGLLESRER